MHTTRLIPLLIGVATVTLSACASQTPQPTPSCEQRSGPFLEKLSQTPPEQRLRLVQEFAEECGETLPKLKELATSLQPVIIEIPTPSKTSTPTPEPPKATLSIDQKHIALDGTHILSIRQLHTDPKPLRDALQAIPNRKEVIFNIIATPEVPFESIVEILDLTKELGIQNVVLAHPAKPKTKRTPQP